MSDEPNKPVENLDIGPPDDSEPTSKTPENPWPARGWDALKIVITAAITVAATLGVQAWTGRTRTFNYYVSKTPTLLRTPKMEGTILGHRVELTMDNQRLNDPSLLSLTIVNNSGQDFEDVVIYVDIRNAERKTFNLQLSEARDFDDIVIEPTSPISSTAGRTHLEYRVKYAKSGTTPILKADYLLVNVPPSLGVDMTVSLPGKGMTAQLTDVGDTSRSDAYALMTAVGGACLSLLVAGLGSYVASRRRLAANRQAAVQYAAFKSWMAHAEN